MPESKTCLHKPLVPGSPAAWIDADLTRRTCPDRPAPSPTIVESVSTKTMASPPPASTVTIAALCDDRTYAASLAPIADLATLSVRTAAEFGRGERSSPPVLELRIIHDMRHSCPFPGAHALDFSKPQDIRYDAVLVPAGAHPVESEQSSPETSEWLRSQRLGGALVAGIGSGVLHLAAAGLLDEKPAAISARYEQRMRKNHPEVRLAHVALVAESDGIITASEIVSVFTLAVTLARFLHSDGLAERYRRSCGVEEIALAGGLLPTRANMDALVSEARSWIVEHMSRDIRTSDVAAHFNVSTRTLTRRFEQSLGVTPSHYLRDARLDAARSMLRRTRLSIEQIAHLVGYQDTAFFRDLFRRTTGTTPRAFRMAALEQHAPHATAAGGSTDRTDPPEGKKPGSAVRGR